MIKNIKYAVAAAISALVPMSASALTFSSGPGTLADGGTFAFSAGDASIGAIAFSPELGGSITLNILNDVGANLRLAFELIGNTLNGVTYTLDGAPVTPAFGAPIAGLSELVISYTGADAFDSIAFNVSAVPVPAAAALLLTALGGLALVRSRKQA